MKQLRVKLRKLFAGRANAPCPICLLVDDDPSAWSDYQQAFIHLNCIPAWVRKHPEELVQKWLRTGELPSPGEHVTTQVAKAEPIPSTSV